MIPDYSYTSFSPVEITALCIYREGRNQPYDTRMAIGCSIRNRVQHPGWWGHDYRNVVTTAYQYSSFNTFDPNYKVWPADDNPIWLECLEIASLIINGKAPDTSNRATSYFDKSLDHNPPKWAASMTHVKDIGAMHFYKREQD